MRIIFSALLILSVCQGRVNLDEFQFQPPAYAEMNIRRWAPDILSSSGSSNCNFAVSYSWFEWSFDARMETVPNFGLSMHSLAAEIYTTAENGKYNYNVQCEYFNTTELAYKRIPFSKEDMPFSHTLQTSDFKGSVEFSPSRMKNGCKFCMTKDVMSLVELACDKQVSGREQQWLLFINLPPNEGETIRFLASENDIVDDSAEEELTEVAPLGVPTTTVQKNAVVENLESQNRILSGIDIVLGHSLPLPSQPVCIGNYYEGHLIGQGGFGEVFQGIHKDSGESVAIKRVWLKGERKDLLMNEIRMQQLLQKHPHPYVMTATDYMLSPSSVFFIMDRMTAGSLEEFMLSHKDSKLEEPLARRLFIQLIEGISHLHSLHMMHRDLKPANLLMSYAEDGLPGVVLIDYGLAEIYKPGQKLTLAAGTPGYFAPEIEMVGRRLKGFEHGYEPLPADLYTCGVILLQMLSGEVLPYAGKLDDVFPSRTTLENDDVSPLFVSPAAEHIVRGLMNNDPKQRMTLQQLKSTRWFTQEMTVQEIERDTLTNKERFKAKLRNFGLFGNDEILRRPGHFVDVQDHNGLGGDILDHMEREMEILRKHQNIQKMEF